MRESSTELVRRLQMPGRRLGRISQFSTNGVGTMHQRVEMSTISKKSRNVTVRNSTTAATVMAIMSHVRLN